MSTNDVIEIKHSKGNIPINLELLEKYNNVSELMNNNINKYDGKVCIFADLDELRNIDLSTVNKSDMYRLATCIFAKYNNKRIFVNDGNEIIVSNGDIKESINKIMHNDSQRNYLREHILIFSDLGDIIESATLTGQTIESKNREDNNIWSYYLNGVTINNKLYLFEFDVVSRSNNENHYRVQRLQEIVKKTDTTAGNIADSNITPTLVASASEDNIT